MQNLPQDDQNNTTTSNSPGGLNNLAVPPTASGLSKETEPIASSETPVLEEMVADVELEPDVEAAGIEKKSETIVLPPDVKKMGVTSGGPAQPVSSTSTVKLPLTDDQIATGLNAQIVLSIRWLSEWCVRQLKKAHFHLRVISGHAVREPDGK